MEISESARLVRRAVALGTVVAALALLISACSSDEAQKSADAPVGACAAGEQAACTCDNGETGVQLCADDGAAWGRCEGCVASDAGVQQSDAGGSPCGECAGCCDGDACVDLAEQTQAACGRNAITCDSCIEGEACVQGKCLVDTGVCSPASCPSGCCLANTCVQAVDQDHQACGSSGQGCTSCEWGVVCDAGSCTSDIATGQEFFVAVTRVVVRESDGDQTWDSFGGLPDVYVCVSDATNAGCTTTRQDTTTGQWSVDEVLVDGTGAPVTLSSDTLLQGGWRYAVWDEDPVGADLIQEGTISLRERASEYAIEPNDGALVELVYQLLP